MLLRKRRCKRACLAAAWLIAVWICPAHAQEEPAAEPSTPAVGAIAPGGQFAAEVRDLSAETLRITVPLHKSVIVETSVPLERVQAISADIAYVQTISPMQLLITGADYGATQVIAWSNGEQHIFEVTVELDLTALNETLRKIDPQSTAEATSFLGNIVLSGTVSGPEMAQRMEQIAQIFAQEAGRGGPDGVQNHLTVAGEQQVLLRCTVAEVNRSAVRALGINGFLAGDDFQDVFVVNNLGGLNPTNISPLSDVNARSTIPFVTGDNVISDSTTLALGFPRVQMQVFLRALADNSLLRILAEPNLTAISGETASFLAGGEFPYPIPQALGAIAIEFREFGIRLQFTPVVLDHQRIRLRVAPEVSETDFSSAMQVQGISVPGLTQRRAETTVEVGNGQTIAIAGLLDDEVRGVVSRVPGVGDVPILGALFRSVEYRRRVTELVILVTPEIIAPLNPDQVSPVPGQFITPPNDYQLYALGLLEGEPAQDPSIRTDVYKTATPARVGLKSQADELSIHGPWGHETVWGL
ncbi:MAG: type II and III secretion system protein family protein [Phycisphaerales bacterium]|nr:MAG: type II and III secretion system protein family protein [Phycisphaerales bacterium]